MSTPGARQPSCVGHNYNPLNVIPMDLDATASTLREAITEIRKMIASLRSRDSLEPEESRHRPPAKKRKVENEKKLSGINNQVDKALNKITYTEDWSGQCGIQHLIRTHGTEWNRKWGDTYGVYHDMLQVYPEYSSEIHRDQAKPDTIFTLIDTFRSLSASLRNEARNAVNRKADKRDAKRVKASVPGGKEGARQRK